MEASELKRRLAQGRGRRGYPAELREAVVAYATRRRAERVSQGKVAAELGMSPQTLCYWRALARQRGGIAPVAIVAQREPVSREVVVECGPLRVRGLDVAGVAELLRRLG
jgi:transposase-like protein